MKKLLSIIILAVLILSFGSSAFAQSVDSVDWKIKFNLSDRWNPDYDDPEVLCFRHKNDYYEFIEIVKFEDSTLSSVRSDQAVIDEIYNEFFSDETCADRLTASFPTITEKYQNRRYETYNGAEYYRGEKMFYHQAAGYYSGYCYTTLLSTVQHGTLYMISYTCNDDNARHFSDVTALLNSMVYTGGVGHVINQALTTDIVATINGHHIPSFNVDGLTYIVAEDLRYYGFSVNYDNNTRSLSINRDTSQSYVSKSYTKPYVAPSQVGKKEHDILSTDITTYLNGSYVESYNINGQTIICFNSLGSCGPVAYDDNLREISLSLYGIQ